MQKHKIVRIAKRHTSIYTIRFTGMRVKQHDGGQLQGIGIQPDVFVEETIQGIKEGRDEYLEKAME
ncbi:hypothetical protein, partial [Pedobacter sp.]|uniref:hypothetical protein n=1 Tax=Pedobacter sp. TaxID=1411316 RepID=UPI003D7F44F1